MWDKPRDPERIQEILTAFEARWREVPDQRFGQVLMNLVRRDLRLLPEKEGYAIFAVEDNMWLKMLRDEYPPNSSTDE